MSGIEQLVDMGASRGKARVALERCKGDVMQAAELVFSGELDSIPDEEEEEVARPRAGRRSGTGGGNLPTPDADDDGEIVLGGLSEDGDQDEDDEMDAQDEDEDEEDDDEGEDYGADVDDFEDTAAAGPTAGHDPYGGVFFSKDRREEVIEVEETPEKFKLVVHGKMEEGDNCTFGEWMSGCPEKGEQERLFGSWTEHTENVLTCPCGEMQWTRKKSDFFPIMSSFPAYLAHLRTLVRKSCPKCSRKLCFSCGEEITDAPTREVDAEGRGKVRSSLGGLAIPNGDGELNEALFHCPSLQGVVLGVGLIMVSRLFADLYHLQGYQPRSSYPSTSTNGAPASKKRKVAPSTTSTTKAAALSAGSTADLDDDDEDDEEAYGTTFARGSKAKAGTGYEGSATEDHSGQKAALVAQSQRDSRLGTVLSQVRVFLPNLRRKGGGKTSDYLVHPTTLAHVRRRFNGVSSLLLRNDSITDMCDREKLYFELFEWLETISNHEALCSAMAMPTMVRLSSVPRPSPSTTTSSHKSLERTVTYEGSAGPRELMENLVIQASAAKKGFESTSGKKRGAKKEEEVVMTEQMKRMGEKEREEFLKGAGGKGKEKVSDNLLVVGDEDDGGVRAVGNGKLIDFCTRILDTAAAIDRALTEQKGSDFVNRLHASLPKIMSSAGDHTTFDASVVKASDSEEEIRRIYQHWAEKVRFEYCDLQVPGSEDAGAVAYVHAFSKDIVALSGSNLPKRSLAIAKELAVLTTNLPVGFDGSIFLRVDESRVDVIKALIIGPADTPYANGCFLFDIHLPMAYNTSPPNVKTMTTAGGTQRLNPNLYAEGKVCLSLLGTWSGPGWVAGTSTLLQVLISIQAMILNEEPFLNEPGWASGGGTVQSKRYSQNVRRMVVNDAMLNNLRTPPYPFENVIRTHFRLKSRVISAQLDKWLELDDGFGTSGANGGNSVPGPNALKDHVASMKKLLTKLENGEEIGASD